MQIFCTKGEDETLGFVFNGNCSIIKSQAYTCIFNLLGICVQGEKVEVNGDIIKTVRLKGQC